jgi:hypothetical protein
MFGVPNEVVIGIVTGALSFFAKNEAMKRQDQKELWELQMKINSQQKETFDAASKRSSPVLRKIVASIIILVAFVGLFYIALKPDINVTMLSNPRKHSILFGLLSWVSKPELIEANGFFLPDYLRYGVYSVIGFLFGGSLAKASK